MTGATILGEVGKNFPHHTAKFKTMAGKTTGDKDTGAFWMGVNDKMGIRAVSKEAGVHRQRRPVPVGKIAAHKSPQDGLIGGRAFAVHERWIIDNLFQMVPAREFETGDTINGQTVKSASSTAMLNTGKVPT